MKRCGRRETRCKQTHRSTAVSCTSTSTAVSGRRSALAGSLTYPEPAAPAPSPSFPPLPRPKMLVNVAGVDASGSGDLLVIPAFVWWPNQSATMLPMPCLSRDDGGRVKGRGGCATRRNAMRAHTALGGWFTRRFDAAFFVRVAAASRLVACFGVACFGAHVGVIEPGGGGEGERTSVQSRGFGLGIGVVERT